MANPEKYQTTDEDVEAVLVAHDELYDATSRPVHLDAVFDNLKMEQIKLTDRRFGSVEEAQSYVLKVIEQFEKECAEKQIIPRPVRITGDGITWPRQENDPFTGMSTTIAVPIDQIESHLPLIVHHQGIDGTFMGLGYQLTRLDDAQGGDDDAIACQAQLRYQVSVGGGSHLNGYSTFAVTGNVLTTQLEFAADRRRREFDEIYNKLLETASPQTARYIDMLIMTLSQYDDYAPSTLKTISNLVDLITQSKDFIDDVAKNVVIEELLRFHINLQPNYTLLVPDELVKTAEGYIPLTMTKSDEPLCYDQKLTSIVLAPRYYKREGQFVICPDRQVPYFVADSGDKVHYLPMGRMIGFYAQGNS